MGDVVEVNLTDTETVIVDVVEGTPLTVDVIEETIEFNVIGETGTQGPAGTITIEPTVTGLPGTDADVVNVGTPEAAILRFTIPAGEQGEVGPQGPQGESGGFYHHAQLAPATTWVITHNLGYRPSVNVQDSGGNQWFGDVTYIDENTVTVSFAYPFGGTADLS